MRSLLLLTSILFSSPILFAATQAPVGLLVQVVDDAGTIIETPHVFILNESTHRSLEASGLHGIVSLDVSPGPYRVYSAISKSAGGGVDRYVSAVAYLRITGEQNASVILRVQLAKPPVFYLSEVARKKIGLTTELAQYLN